ncbi:hypothetical protein UG54_01370 [Gordonia sihwensis]|nr:hypothetical protein UG54_01370 [Gordonia sihwensis]
MLPDRTIDALVYASDQDRPTWRKLPFPQIKRIPWMRQCVLDLIEELPTGARNPNEKNSIIKNGFHQQLRDGPPGR